MAKAKKQEQILREPAETQYAQQLEALAQNDPDTPPQSWKLSPRAVLLYITGGKTLNVKIKKKSLKVPITRKFFGDERLVERAVITLASERALLLVGDPGTGKSWLSEHLAAAISGNSTLVIQGTAGTTEDHIKYSWNIARVIAESYTPENLIPSPTMVAMRSGGLLRFEEITRCVPEVQDALVSILSEKNIAIPELPDANTQWATRGFNVIATANSRDQGVNELSAALKRRFNYIHIPVVEDQKTEEAIITERLQELSKNAGINAEISPSMLKLLATVFREIRSGVTAEGVSIKKPSTTISTAETISVALDAVLYARYYGDGVVKASDIAHNLTGSMVKEDLTDIKVLREYINLVAKKRAKTDNTWQEFYQAAKKAL